MTLWTFPLIRGSKEPACEWRKPENQIPWVRGAHVGVDCGRSGLVVIDCDCDKATGDPFGSEEFHHMWQENENSRFPETFTVFTPSGGTHIYFRALEGREIRNSAGRTRKSPSMPHVDVRGAGGFVVAPLAMDGKYSIGCSRPPIPLPEWLCEALTKPEPRPMPAPGPLPTFGRTYAERALEGEVKDLLATGEGGRNDQLNRAAFNLGTLVASGALEPGRVEDILTATARAMGLPESELRKTIRSGLVRGAQASPRTGRN